MAHWHRSGGHADLNQNPLVKFARRLGASVTITSHVGKDFPDAVIGFREVNLLWEFKQPAELGKRGKPRKAPQLTQGQEDFRNTWLGTVETIRTAEDVVRSLLRADKMRPLDSTAVPDDYLAAIVKTIRANLPELMKGL